MVPPQRSQHSAHEPLGSRSQTELIECARAGEAEAFDDLVRAFYASLLATAFHLLGNREDAEDLVQDTFVDAHRALDRFAGDGAFESWLRGILVNKVRDRFRRQGRGPAFLEGLDWETLRDERGAGEARRAEASRLVQHGLARLPERLRLTLSLRALDGRSYEDIASLTGVTPATSRTRAVKARRLLMRLLEPWWGSDR